MSDDTPKTPAAGRTGEADGKDSLPAIADVLDYLLDGGWKVTRTSLYRHAKEGKLLPDPGGTFSVKAVDKYARTFLKKQSTGKKVSEKIDELQRRKIELDIDVAEIAKKRSQFAFERDQKLYILRGDVWLELATRAGVLDTDFTYWIKSNAAEWVRLVGGDMNKLGEFKAQMIRGKEAIINSYAAPMEFDVVIGAEDEESGPEAAGEAGEEAEPC